MARHNVKGSREKRYCNISRDAWDNWAPGMRIPTHANPRYLRAGNSHITFFKRGELEDSDILE